jgi:hypothetical protein
VNIETAFPSKYLKASIDIPEDGDLLVTIDRVSVESVGQDDPEEKPIVYFREVEKGMILNKTNANTIAGLYGAETDGWVGKRVALYGTEVNYQGKMTLSIRVRMKAPPSTNNNGFPKAAPSDRQRWEEFLSNNNIAVPDVTTALGTPKVSEWLAGNPGADLNKAMELVLSAKEAAEVTF